MSSGLIMATLYDVAHFCSWNGYPQDMKGYIGTDKASWTNQEFWFPYGVNALYGRREKTRLLSICENIYRYGEIPRIIARVKELLAYGAKPDIKDLNGMSPLLRCARDGLGVTMKLLLAAGADINQKDNDGDTALTYAALYNKNDIIKELLNNGANPNIMGNDGHFPLKISACEGYIDIIKLLVNGGADINQVGADINQVGTELSALDYAVDRGHLNVVKYLYEHGAIVTDYAFGRMIAQEHINILQYFKKVGVNAPVNSIYQAVDTNKPKLINLLSKMGGNLNYISDNGDTPLSLALAIKSYECMEALCKAGAIMTIPNDNNHPPIQLSLLFGDYKAIQILLANGVDVNTTIADMPLLDYGILNMDVNKGDDKFKTCVKEIIKRSPDFTLLNRFGRDAAEYARRLGYDDIVVCIKRAALAGKYKKVSRPRK